MPKTYHTYILSLLAAVLLAFGWKWWHPWMPQIQDTGVKLRSHAGVRIDSLPGRDGFPALNPYARYLPGPEMALENFVVPTRSYAPWLSWPVLGSDLSDIQLVREIQKMYTAGFGGLVLQAAPGAETGNRQYFHQLRFLAREAEKRGMQVDWAMEALAGHSTQKARSLTYGESYVRGGKMVNLPLPTPQIDYAEQTRRAFAQAPLPAQEDSLELLAVYAFQARKADRSTFYWDLLDQVQYAPDSLFIITEALDDKGVLHWQAPKGYWWVLAVYAKGVVPQTPGFPHTGWIDPLDSLAVLSHLTHFFDSLHQIRHHIGAGFRGILRTPQYFAADRLYHPALWEEVTPGGLRALFPYLPSLLGPGEDQLAIHQHQLQTAAPFEDSALDSRLRLAYDMRKGERILSQSLLPPQKWGLQRGLTDQAYPGTNGTPLLEASRQSLFPGVELGPAGGRAAYLKMISSPAGFEPQKLLAGQIWPHDPIVRTANAQKLRLASEKMLQQGINHITWPYHAWAYPGTTNSLLSDTDWLQLNQEVSRDQYLQRSGRPVADIWVYYPFADFPHWSNESFDWPEFGSNGKLIGYDDPFVEPKASYAAPVSLPTATDPRAIWLNKVMPFLLQLEAAGYHWQWVNDHTLAEVQSTDTPGWQYEQAEASAILLPFVPAWKPALYHVALQHLPQQAPLYWIGSVPDHSQEFWQADGMDAKAARFAQAQDNKFQFHELSQFEDFLRRAPWPQRISFYGSADFLQWQERVLEDGSRLFRFFNTRPVDRHSRFSLQMSAEEAYWLFPGEGRIVPARSIEELELYLPPYSTRYLWVGNDLEIADSLLSPLSVQEADLRRHGRPLMQLDQWDFLLKKEEGKLYAKDQISLFDWREDPLLRNTGKEAVYTVSFSWADTVAAKGFVLDLGEVHGTAEVWLNKLAVGQQGYSPYRYDLGPALQAGYNTLEIWVRPPLYNSMISQNAHKDPKLPEGWENKRVKAGLIGPVWLWEWMPSEEMAQ